MTSDVINIYLAGPRGFCAGVDIKEIENLPNADDQQMAFTALANETVILTEEDHATRVNDHDLAKKSMRLTKTILARLG